MGIFASSSAAFPLPLCPAGVVALAGVAAAVVEATVGVVAGMVAGVVVAAPVGVAADVVAGAVVAAAVVETDVVAGGVVGEGEGATVLSPQAASKRLPVRVKIPKIVLKNLAVSISSFQSSF